jgi:hypothetical protein
MSIDFNSVRRSAYRDMEKLIQVINGIYRDGDLPQSALPKIESAVNDLRVDIAAIASTYKEGDEDFQMVCPGRAMEWLAWQDPDNGAEEGQDDEDLENSMILTDRAQEQDAPAPAGPAKTDGTQDSKLDLFAKPHWPETMGFRDRLDCFAAEERLARGDLSGLLGR